MNYLAVGQANVFCLYAQRAPPRATPHTRTQPAENTFNMHMLRQVAVEGVTAVYGQQQQYTSCSDVAFAAAAAAVFFINVVKLRCLHSKCQTTTTTTATGTTTTMPFIHCPFAKLIVCLLLSSISCRYGNNRQKFLINNTDRHSHPHTRARVQLHLLICLTLYKHYNH